jgi:hypothetical protein
MEGGSTETEKKNLCKTFFVYHKSNKTYLKALRELELSLKVGRGVIVKEVDHFWQNFSKVIQ